MREKLFHPLSMFQTFTSRPPENLSNDLTKAYATLSDGSPFEIHPPRISDTTIMFAGGSVSSTLPDLLQFYGSYLQVIKDQMVITCKSKRGSKWKMGWRVKERIKGILKGILKGRIEGFSLQSLQGAHNDTPASHYPRYRQLKRSNVCCGLAKDSVAGQDIRIQLRSIACYTHASCWAKRRFSSSSVTCG